MTGISSIPSLSSALFRTENWVSDQQGSLSLNQTDFSLDGCYEYCVTDKTLCPVRVIMKDFMTDMELINRAVMSSGHVQRFPFAQ